MDNPKKLTRSRKNRMFGGVASGLGEYLNLDPVIIRILFVILAFLGGGGIILYIILLFIIPEDNSTPFNTYEQKKNDTHEMRDESTSDEEKKAEHNDRSENNISETARNRKKNSVAGVAIGVLMIAFGFYILFSKFFSFNWSKYFFPIMLLCAGVMIILSSMKYNKS